MTDASPAETSSNDMVSPEDTETAEYLERLQDVASNKYCSDTNGIEVGPLTVDDISETAKGVWVRGWLWLSRGDDLG